MKLRTIMTSTGARPTACLALLVGASLSLSSCGDKKPDGSTDTDGGDGKKAPPAETEKGKTPETVDTPAPVAGTSESQHFAAVAQHLDLGGTIFGYLDVDGDVEKIAGLAQEFLDMAKEQAGDDMPPHLKALDLSKVLGKLGFDGVEAIGVSSYKDGDLYHNKMYLHVPAGRKGLMKIIGGDAKPFLAKELAPKDSDLVIEQSLDIRAGFEVVDSLVADIGGPDAAEQFNAAVGEAIPELGLSMADLFRKLDTRLTIVGRIHPDKPLQIPDAPVEFPSFDLLIALDDLGWLYEKVTGNMKKEIPADQQAQMFTKGDGFERLGMPPMPDPENPIAQPIIHHDIANKRILVASSPAFLEECLAGATNLSDSADFTASTKGLPAEGNGLSYVSARLMNEYRNLVKGSMSANQGDAETAVVAAMLDGWMPELKTSQASVTVNTKEGVLSISNSTQSLKEAVVMGGVAGVAMGAAMTIPAMKSAQDRAREMQMQNDARLREMEEKMRELDEGAAPVPPAPVPVPGE